MKFSFFARYSFLILLVFAFISPFLLGGTRRALRSNTNDVRSWLPAAYEETATFNWYWDKFPTDAFVLASWEGCTLDDERLDLMARKLAPPPPDPNPKSKDFEPYFFTEVVSGRSILQMLVEERGVPREEAIERLQGGLIGPDGKQTCLLLTVSPYAMQLSSASSQAYRKFMHGALEKIASTAETECAIPRADLHMGGPPVDNVAIDQEGERSLLRLAGLSGIVGLAMSWVCLRCWKLTAIVFMTAIIGAGFSLAAVFFSGAKMNAILLTMPALVYVAATSGAIHLANYFRDAVKTGGLAGAADRAVRNAWLPLALATGTTAIGLASLAISELKPIQMFGIYSAVGVVVSFLVLCTLMPACLQIWPPANLQETVQGEQGPVARLCRRGGRWVLEHNRLVTAACLLLMVGGAYGATHIQTSVKLMRLFSPEAQIIADYTWLEKHLGPLVPMEVVIRVDKSRAKLDLFGQVQLISEVQRAISDMPEVGAAMAVPTFAQPLPARAGLVQRAAWNTMLEKNRPALRDFLCSDGQEELWRVSARVPALTDIDYGLFVQDIRRVVDPIVEKYRARGVEGVSAVYTGLVPVIYKAQHSMLDGLILGFAGDLALIGIAMVFLMRNFSAGVLLILPSIFPLAVLFGAMGLGGIVVDTGTVMTPAVALGVTVDDAIHFMLWCRHGEQKGLNRHDAIMFAYDDCARAIYQSWSVIGLGLFAFALSSFTPTMRFGYLMLGMLTLSSLGNLVFLPALLASPLGNFFWSRETRRGEVATPAEETPPLADPAALPVPHYARSAARKRRAG